MPRRRRRHGMIFVLALGIIVILCAMILIFAQNMRTEAIGSANRRAAIQASAIEEGAEQWVLNNVETYPGDALSIIQIPAEAIPIGKGYFWVLRPDPTTDQFYAFGITDEASKLNLNASVSDSAPPARTPATQPSYALINLPGMTSNVADPIVDWHSLSGSTSSSNGAKSDYYEGLKPIGYEAKYAPFETVEELFLVKNSAAPGTATTDLWKQLLYGYDLNRNGVIDPAESGASGAGAEFDTGNTDSRGIINYVTVFTVEPNTTIAGAARTQLNGPQNAAALQKALLTVLTQQQVTQIMARIRGRTFNSIGDFYQASGLSPADFGKVADLLTTSTAKTTMGLVNVNTAPGQVLMCLPGMTQTDAESLTSARSGGADLTSIAWVYAALQPAAKAAAIANSITSRSYQYSADIVAVSGDGRAFRRVRIVVDAQTSPAKIVYRKDLTSLGWPLPTEYRDQMRLGQFAPMAGMASGGSQGLTSGVH